MREQLHASSDTYPLVVIIADGWTKSVYDELLNAGDLPNIQKDLIESGGSLSSVVGNVPSISIASHASILTGSFPDEHSIAAHRWIDSGHECHNYLSMLGPNQVERDLSPSARTIHEAHRHVAGIAVQSIVRRGASYSTRLPTMRSERILRKASDLIQEQPRSTASIWLPRGDAMGHRFGPSSREVRADMRDTDHAIGRFIRTIVSNRDGENARILFIPDHGQRRVSRHADLHTILGGGKRSVRVNPRSVGGSPDIVAMTSGDSAANIYARAGIDLRKVAEKSLLSDDVLLACLHVEDHHLIMSRNGMSKVQIGPDAEFEYELICGADPLQVLANPHKTIKFSPEEVRPEDVFPDFLHQYLRAHVPGRSADLLLLAGEEVDFGNGPRFGYRLGFHRGTHGGPSRAEVVVSAAYRGPIVEDVPVRSADVLGHLGFVAREAVGDVAPSL